ncbi:hypothetical protein U1438_00330 [Aeromonas caviae]|uniref:hypothetical protein n=1 Tax=Aeromonas caviae TaxID=648 RepID=UPI0030145A45
MPDWMYVVMICIGVIGVSAIFAWFLVSILGEIFETIALSDFSKDFKDTVKHSTPTWDDIKEIASSRGLTQSKIQNTIRKYHREIMAGREVDLSPHKELIKGYINQYKNDEPFEGLPSEIRIHLERLRDQTNGNNHLLEPLTSQIKDLLTINEKEKRHQKYYTIGGFFIGLAGFAFALYTSLIQPQIALSNKEQPTPQIEITSNSLQSATKTEIK